MKRHLRLLGAIVGVLTTVGAMACCSTRAAAPAGYERIGVADGATLYAKKEDQARVSILLRSREGEQLCDSSGPVGTDIRGPLPALCDGSSGDTYAFVLPILKAGPVAPAATCDKQSGAAEPVTRVGSPSSWTVDFMVAVRPVASTQGIVVCPQ